MTDEHIPTNRCVANPEVRSRITIKAPLSEKGTSDLSLWSGQTSYEELGCDFVCLDQLASVRRLTPGCRRSLYVAKRYTVATRELLYGFT